CLVTCITIYSTTNPIAGARETQDARTSSACGRRWAAGRRADLLEKPWSHWADLMAADNEAMVPGIHADITRLDIYAWGHHVVIPSPGFLTGDARRALTRPLGRIIFAHSDRNGMPSFELATRAGYDAAREALERLRPEARES